MRQLREQVLRFLLVGGANTLATFVLLAILATLIDPVIAYTLVFAAGLVFTSIMTGRFVFVTELSAAKVTSFVLWYLAVYAVGVTVVRILDDQGHTSAIALSFIAVCVTAPLSFLGGRLIFSEPSVGNRGG